MRHMVHIVVLLLGVSSFCLGEDKSAAPADGGNWIVHNDSNPMDNTKQATAIVKSETGEEWLGVRCTGRKMDILVDTNKVVDDEYATVRVKFDDGKIQVQHQGWQRSADMTALFSRDVKKLIIQLRTAKRFYFEYEPYQQRRTTLTFKVESLPLTECK
jgi:hypothetical protein